MEHLEPILSSHPNAHGRTATGLSACIEASLVCLASCSTCADACLAEARPELTRCIRLNQDCADLCIDVALALSRAAEPQWSTLAPILKACATLCAACAVECERHADLEHCRLCAVACRRCERACFALIPAPLADAK
jgi:hypothetical protein